MSVPAPPFDKLPIGDDGNFTPEWNRYLYLVQRATNALAPIDATYWTSSANSTLTNETNLGLLASGYLKIVTAAAVATPSSVSSIPTSDLSGTVGLANGGTNANLSATGGAGQFLKQASAGASVTVVAPAETDLTFTDVTTNNVSTSKHGFAPKAPNDATKFLDGTGAYSVPASGSVKIMASTLFEASGRFGGIGLGTETYNTSGLEIDTTALAGTVAGADWQVFSALAVSGDLMLGNPVFTASFQMQTFGTDFQTFVGIGVPTVGVGGITYTAKHVGIKIVRSASGTASVFATQADGTTETASSALYTVVQNDLIEVSIAINTAGGSAVYTTRKNGSAQTTTTLATNLPTALGIKCRFALTNVNVASDSQLDCSSASYSR